MEDCDSVKSNESIATSDEFDFISDKPCASKTPTLNFVNGNTIHDLKHYISEAMQESESNSNDGLPRDAKKVGQSMFYTSPVEPGTDPLSIDIIDSSVPSPTEKQDLMKPDYSDEEGMYSSSFLKIKVTMFIPRS